MRRWTAWFVVLTLLLLPAPGAFAEEYGWEESQTENLTESWTEISDFEGLRAIAENPAGFYRLTEDLDLGGTDWEPFPFFGTLDGAGHTLYNLRVRSAGPDVRVTRDGNLKAYDTVFGGLFSVVEGGEIYDLNLLGVDVCIDGWIHCFAAPLAGCSLGGTFRNCRTEGKVRLNNYDVMTGVSGLVGYGWGSVADCAVSAELIFEDRNTDSRCEEFMGGILACGIMDISGCTVEIRGFDSCCGYVHNGGVAGMYYHCGMEVYGGTVINNTVTGQISFFENNPDRRAYCSGIIGESLTTPMRDGNTEEFYRDETWDYSSVLLPEKCEYPDYLETVTPPGCDSWGFTVHSCAACGYQWTDSYTPPAHAPGEWVTEGEMERSYCTVCGTLLGERAVPPPPTEAPAPTPQPEAAAPEEQPEAETRKEAETDLPALPESLRLRYKESAVLTPVQETAEQAFVWTSSAPEVVTVDRDGKLTATGIGLAVVTCTSADGTFSDVCEVTVHFTFWQVLIELFLFGWLWY